MNRSVVAFAAVAIISGFAGATITNELNAITDSQQSSSAGQTLADLARAIESERTAKGEYPDTITNLKVESRGGDFSAEMLKNVLYFRTDTGFVAFVGRPKVAYIYPGVSTTFK